MQVSGPLHVPAILPPEGREDMIKKKTNVRSRRIWTRRGINLTKRREEKWNAEGTKAY
jgi:hypothetical protein